MAADGMPKMSLRRAKALSNLETVQLMGPQTRDEDLEAIKQSKHLILVDLVNTSVTEAGVVELKKALPGCLVRRR